MSYGWLIVVVVVFIVVFATIAFVTHGTEVILKVHSDITGIKTYAINVEHRDLLEAIHGKKFLFGNVERRDGGIESGIFDMSNFDRIDAKTGKFLTNLRYGNCADLAIEVDNPGRVDYTVTMEH
jgi:hypothetical protein